MSSKYRERKTQLIVGKKKKLKTVSFVFVHSVGKTIFLMILNLDPDELNTEFLCSTGENIDYY